MRCNLNTLSNINIKVTMNKLYYLLISLIIVSCSNDEPEPETFMQIASITNEDGSVCQQFSYDSYGRIANPIFCSYESDERRSGLPSWRRYAVNR